MEKKNHLTIEEISYSIKLYYTHNQQRENFYSTRKGKKEKCIISFRKTSTNNPIIIFE